METADTFLEHYGVKGMHWGVRRDTSPQKVTTYVKPGQKVQTTGGKRQKPSQDAIRAAVLKQKAKKSSPDALTNKQLQELLNRMNMEKQYSTLTAADTSRGKAAVNAMRSLIGDKEAAMIGGFAGTASASPAIGFGVGAAARAVGTKQKSKKKK